MQHMKWAFDSVLDVNLCSLKFWHLIFNELRRVNGFLRKSHVDSFGFYLEIMISFNDESCP